MSAGPALDAPLERTLYLRSLPAFDGLRSTELGIIAQLMHEETIPRGAVLYDEGEPHHELRILVRGTVRNERDGAPVYREAAPAALGVNGLLGGPPASLRGVAETRLQVLTIDGAAFLDVLEDHFDVFLQIRKLMADRVTALQRELGMFHTPPASPLVLPADTVRPLDIVERLLCLRRTRAFCDVPINALAQMIRGQRDLHACKGETLWRAGDPGASLLLVIDGEVDCAPGDEDAAFRAGPGYVLGADAAFGGVAYAYEAVAASGVEALRIDTTILTDVIEDHFEVGLRTLAHFAREEIRLLERKSPSDPVQGLGGRSVGA